ncbi:MAG: hypothetical protein RL148_1180 [Planctomycetota bacterium]
MRRSERAWELRQALSRSPIAGLLMPRQCGKTTLARRLEPDRILDLESSIDRQVLRRRRELDALVEATRVVHGLGVHVGPMLVTLASGDCCFGV